MRIFAGNITANPNFTKEFSRLGLKYGVSIGRRQPMHIAHLDCLKEIIGAGLTPIIIYGSHNSPDSKFYNPIKNPFNQEQQQKILSEIMGSKFPGVKFHSMFIHDYEDNNDWIQRINYELTQIAVPKEAVIIHYRTKQADLQNSAEQIRPLSFYNDYFTKNGFAVWQSQNMDHAMDNINSTDFRRMSIVELASQKNKLVNFDYIAETAKSAREDNRAKSFLQKLPISMLDLSIKKIADEMKVDYQEIIPRKEVSDLSELSNYITERFIKW